MLSLRPSRLSTLVLASCASLAMLASPAIAQPGGGGGGRPAGGGMGMFGGGMMGGAGLDPRVTSEQLEKYADILRLTADEYDAAKALWDGYFAAHQEKAAAMRTAIETARDQFRETRDPSVWQEIGTKGAQFRTASAEAEKTFMADVKSLLTADQAALWEVVERTHRRDTSMQMGMLSGERADVIRLTDSLNLSDETKAALAPILDSYAQDLDRELIKRNELFEAGMAQGPAMFQAFRTGDQAAQAEAEKMLTQGREAGNRVRDTNRRYAKQVEAVLPPDKAAEFATAFKKESFPMLYSRTRYAATVIDAASNLADANDSQKEGLQAIRDTYTRDTAALNAKAEAALEQQEQNFSIQNMFRGGDNGPMQELRTARTELENSTVEKVKALLTPEQRTKLPEQRADNGGGPGGQPGQAGQGGQGGGRQPRGQRNNNRNQPAEQPKAPPRDF